MLWLPSKRIAARTGCPSKGSYGVAQAASSRRPEQARAEAANLERILQNLYSLKRSRIPAPPVRERLALPQQQMQVRLLPGARAQIARVPALGGAEFRPVHDAAPGVVHRRRVNLVEHFVEHDHLHEVAGDAQVVERRMDPDHLLVVEVDAHLDRAASPAGAAPAPSDARLHGPGELARVQAGVDRRE